MKKQFVNYTIAKELKELDFDEKCFGWYDNKRSFFSTNNTLHTSNSRVEDRSNNIIAAPLWQQVIDWFREKHGIVVIYDMSKIYFASYNLLEKHQKFNVIVVDKNSSYIANEYMCGGIIIYDTYEEARGKAILLAIKIIKQRYENN